MPTNTMHNICFVCLRCCNTCESVLEAYRVRGWSVPDPDAFEQCKDEKEAGSLAAIGQEGCRLVGQLGVNKVAGAFHIAPGKSYGQGHVHVHDLMAFSGKQVSSDLFLGVLLQTLSLYTA